MTKATKTLPLHEPILAGNEWRYVKECLDTAWVSSAGEYVTRFERMAAERAGTRHAVAVVNGTAALHLALQAAGVQRGDEVLVPSLTFIATANAAAYLGALPRFVDAEEPTFGMDPDRLAAWLKSDTELLAGGARRHKQSGRRVAACVPMHAFGHPVRIDALLEACAGLPVVEDAAESLGSSYRGRPTGSFGLAGCFSFNGNKIVTTGGGGMVVTDDETVARRVRHLSTQAKKDSRAYLHDEVGYNYRLPNINAALGCAQLEQLDGFLESKRGIAGWYREELAGLAGLTLLWEPADARSNFWLNTVRADSSDKAAALMARLNGAGVESRPIWTPGHRQPMFEALTAGGAEVTDRLWRTCFNVPSSANLTRDDVARVCRLLR